MPKYQKIHREPTNKRPEKEQEIIKLDSGFVILTVEIGIHTLVVVIIPMLAMVVEIAIKSILLNLLNQTIDIIVDLLIRNKNLLAVMIDG